LFQFGSTGFGSSVGSESSEADVSCSIDSLSSNLGSSALTSEDITGWTSVLTSLFSSIA